MISTTNNPRVFPMTLFYDDNAPLGQDTKPTLQETQQPQAPDSSELSSQDQMRPIENVPEQKGDIHKSYFTSQPWYPVQLGSIYRTVESNIWMVSRVPFE